MKKIILGMLVFVLFSGLVSAVHATTVSLPHVVSTEEVTVPLKIENAEDVASFSVKVTYDPSVVVVTHVGNSDFDSSLTNMWYAPYGWIKTNGYNIGAGENGDAIMGMVTLNPVGELNDETPLEITVNRLSDSNYQNIERTVLSGSFVIDEGSEPEPTPTPIPWWRLRRWTR